MGKFVPTVPLDPSHEPHTRITELPSTAPVSDILSVLDRDGGLILTDLLSLDQISDIATETAPWSPSGSSATAHSGFVAIPSETHLVGGLVGKSPTIASLCLHPTLAALRTHILTSSGSMPSEDSVETWHIPPLLSISMTFHVRHGAPRQRLHRDDSIHVVDHSLPYQLDKVSQFAVLVAGCETRRENGATMFVLGSHRWDEKRQPRLDEITFAEMAPGSALIFLAGAYHGAGANLVPNFTRVVHGLFFCRGTLRTEENQFLAIPRSKMLAMKPEMQALLGYKQPGAALGLVENGDPMRDLDGVLRAANS